MSSIQIDVVEPPFDRPTTAASAVRLLCRAESVGAFAPQGLRSVLNRELVAEACRALSQHEIARDLAVQVLADGNQELSSEAYRDLLEGMYQQLAESPLPNVEWAHLVDVFSVDDLARLLAISTASLRRYISADPHVRRSTPDAVAGRLHFLALLADALAGAYNNFGIRRWFDRPRAQLDGRSPRELLRDNWQPEDEGPRRVRQLAEELVTLGAT